MLQKWDTDGVLNENGSLFGGSVHDVATDDRHQHFRAGDEIILKQSLSTELLASLGKIKII